MAADLLTEEQARMLSGADALVLREQRSWGDGLVLVVMLALAVVALAHPLWPPVLAERVQVSPVLALFVVAFSLLFASALWADLAAARQPAAWLLSFGPNLLLIKFRSYRHWRWPAQDKVVMRLSPRDLAFVQPIEGVVKQRHGSKTHYKQVRYLEFHLREPLPLSVRNAIRYENTCLRGNGWIRVRSGTNPVLTSADGKVVRLEFGRFNHSFRTMLANLSSRCEVKEKAVLLHATPMDTSKPDLTAAIVRQIELLKAQGQPAEAISLLRAYSPLSLRESRRAVEQGVANAVRHLVREGE